MKVIHQDSDGKLIVAMDWSEWRQATGQHEHPRIGDESTPRDLGAIEDRLRRVLGQVKDAIGETP